MSETTPADAADAPADADEIVEEIERKRTLRGYAAVVTAAIGITFSAFQLWLAAGLAVPIPFVGWMEAASLQSLQANAIHVTFGLLMAFMLFPPTQGDGFVARGLARVVPAARERFGADSPFTAALDRVRGRSAGSSSTPTVTASRLPTWC
ncbi:hypothetical protein [Halospeciosus flavus]|uniref:hypothetical protein n=1 Tax=Halospeciosus flavus TaxID=3032283 RepID=UPI00361CC54E